MSKSQWYLHVGMVLVALLIIFQFTEIPIPDFFKGLLLGAGVAFELFGLHVMYKNKDTFFPKKNKK